MVVFRKHTQALSIAIPIVLFVPFVVLAAVDLSSKETATETEIAEEPVTPPPPSEEDSKVDVPDSDAEGQRALQGHAA